MSLFPSRTQTISCCNDIDSSTNPPTAMVIALMDSFFLELLFEGTDGRGGDKSGDGEGGRMMKEQAFRGASHKREFPTKDELGNV
ncbi:hypothetical protein FH972_011849 [Carpinus fangiana]|uniref:Uncharacterized protein n=1 Tax=Carpinus fangiana TaxID=176857 RepID=A0A660KVM8_9ROSI|nr:hypothetical protein FH972_011849 [Carpinus fangiana]